MFHNGIVLKLDEVELQWYVDSCNTNQANESIEDYLG